MSGSKIKPANPMTPAIFVERARTFLPLLSGHFRRQWPAWALAGVAFHFFQANYGIGYNSTPSLPFKLFLIHYNEPVNNGDYIVFHWHGGEPYPDGYLFTKRVVGTAGDTVLRRGREFRVNGQQFHANEYGITGRELYPVDLPEGESIIPEQRYWVAGTHTFSLDSRYGLLGLVKQQDFVGRAYPIF